MRIANASILAMIFALSGCIVVPEEPIEDDFVTVEPQVLSGGIDNEELEEDRREADGGGRDSGGDDFGGDDGLGDAWY